MSEKQLNSDSSDFTRRSFFKKLWAGVGILAGIELVSALFGFLRPGRSREARSRAGDIIPVGPVDDLAAGSVTPVRKGRFYLVRLADGGFLALTQQCSHLGCSVAWSEGEKRFICPCHSSAFDMHGDVLSPPAPRALDTYPVRIENGIVEVDTSTKNQRTSFRNDQVTYV